MILMHDPSTRDRSFLRGILRVGVFIWLVSLGVAATAQVAAPAIVPSLPEPTPGALTNLLAQIAGLQKEAAARTPVQRKIYPSLLDALREHRGTAPRPYAPRVLSGLNLLPGGRILVDINATVTASVLTNIQQSGGIIVSSFPQYQAIRAEVPVESLEAIAGLNEVKTVRPADLPIHNVGSATSEGDVGHQANYVRSTYGATGSGVKVGVLSDSDRFGAISQGTGDLGGVTVLPGQDNIGTNGDEGEGTAMMEIVHDLAPDAQLFFATGDGGQANMASNILSMATTYGCQVIIDDITYTTESAFHENQPISQAVKAVSDLGVVYFSSAANDGGQDSGTSGAWQGDFNPSGATLPQIPGTLHDWGGGNVFNLVTNKNAGSKGVVLFWSDPWGGSSSDYNLYVTDGAGNVICHGDYAEAGGLNDFPYETTSAATNGQYIVVSRVSGPARMIHVSVMRGGLAVSTAGATRGHNASSAANAFGVAGVVAAGRTTAFGLPGTGGNFYTYSSDGPRRIFYETDGTAVTPGNFTSTGGRGPQKPDITAATGTTASTTFTTNSGFRPFYGTSAAAPHAGAIAALLLSYRPNLSPAQVRAALTNSTLLFSSLSARDQGTGIVMADQAIAYLNPTVSFVYPTNGMTISDTPAPEVLGYADDHTALIASVHLALERTSDGVYYDFASGGWGTASFDTNRDLMVATGGAGWFAQLPGLVNGTYKVFAQSVDSYAHASPWNSVTFVLNLPPLAVNFSPLANAETVFDLSQIGGTLNRAATVTTRFRIQQFEASGTNDLYWNGTSWIANGNDSSVYLAATVTGNNWAPADGVTLPTRGQTRYGPYFLRAVASDAAGTGSTNEILVTRSSPDTTTPVVTLNNILNGQVFTNRALPGLSGSALDNESGITSVQVNLYRFSGGAPVYWNGSIWSPSLANLSVTYNPQTVTWQVNSSLPSGVNLPNGGYGVEIYALNGEAPALNKDLIVNFVVDYHPVYVWTAGSFTDGDPYNNNNNWNNPANWDVLSVPSDDANVVINGGSPDATSSGSVAAHAVYLSNATLTIPGLLVTKLNVFSGGFLSGGAITLATNGVCNWSGGAIGGIFNVSSGAVMNVSNVDQKVLADYAVLNNGGTINWQGGGLILGNGYYASSIITNLPGAIFQSTADGPLFGHYNGNPLVFVNAGGLFAKVAGNGTNSVDDSHFINTGVVRCDSGVLAFNDQLDLNAGGTFGGISTNRVIGGTATVAGLTVVSNSVLELDGGTFTGAGDGSGTFGTTGSGKLIWSGGVLNGTLNLAVNAHTEISGPDTKLFADFATLNNDGQITWLNGPIWANGYYGPSYLRNRTGATFTVAGPNVAAHSNGNLGQLENQPGALLVVNTTGESLWNGWLLINDGTLSGVAGRLNLAQGGAATGLFTNLPGSEVTFSGGTFLLHGGSRFTGTGTARIAGATLTADGLATSEGSSFQLDSGALNGTGFTSRGQFYWNGGVIGGTCSNASGGVFTMTGSNVMVLDDYAVFNNKGTAQLLNSPIMANGYYGGATWNNLAGSFFNVASDGAVLGHFNGNPVVFNNFAGARFAKTAGTNSVLDSGVLNNSGELGCDTGTLSYITTINLNPGGAITGAGQHAIIGGAVAWLGTNALINSTVSFSGGAITGISNATMVTTGGSLLDWSGGTFAGVVTLPGGSSIRLSGSGDKVLGDSAVFNNAGTAWFTGNGKMMANGYYDIATWNNQAGSHFNFATNGSGLGHYNGNPIVFNNLAGARLAKTAGTNSTVDSTILNNSGELGCDSGTFTFNTTLNLNPGGTFTGAGQHLIAGGSVAWNGTNTVQNSSLDFSGGAITGTSNATVVAVGPSLFNWTGGILYGVMTLPSGSTLHLIGGGDRVLGDSAVFNNAGTALFTGAGRLMANGYSDGATWNNLAGSHFNFDTDGSVLGHFNGNPIVFNNLAGARLAKTTGTNTTVDSTILNNSGELGCDSGTFTFNTTLNLNPGGTFTGAGQHLIAGGGVAWNGTNTVQNSSLNFSGGAVVGTSSATMVTAGASLLEWSGGTLYGVMNLQNGSTLRLSGGGDRVLGDSAVFNNAGTALFTGTGRLMANGYQDIGTWNNLAGSHFNFATDGSVLGHFNGNPLVFNNLTGARLAKTAGTNSTVDSTTINNSGELGCDSGNFTFNNTLNLNPGGTFAGTGLHVLDGGTVTLTGTNTVLSPVLSLTGASLVGGAGAALAMAGGSLLDWSGGTLSGTLATLTGSTIRLSGPGNKVMADSAVLNNAGTVRFVGTGPLLANAYYAGAIINNQPGGVIQVFTNATLGRINGAGCFFNNAGSILLSNSPSLFQTDWTFVQTSSGTLGLAIAGTSPGVTYSRFAAGSITLDGSLAITLSGGFVPQTINTFDVLTYSARAGQFSSTQFPTLPLASKWQLTYNPGAITLQIIPGTAFISSSLTNGNFEFSFAGQTGSSCLIEASTNLLNWTPLLTNAPFNGSLDFVDPQTAQFPERYYRATIFP
jgi:hypothetical protein